MTPLLAIGNQLWQQQDRLYCSSDVKQGGKSNSYFLDIMIRNTRLADVSSQSKMYTFFTWQHSS